MSNFGGWAIDYECFNYIRQILPDGSTLLELGSGLATNEFAKHYKVISIEQDINWVGKYNSTYIHAPLKQYVGLQYPWFDVDALQALKSMKYDLILVDAPVAGSQKPTSRHGFHHNLHLFNTEVPILFDDINRQGDYYNMVITANKLNKTYEVFKHSKMFGIVK